MLNNFDRAFLNKVKAWFSNTIYANTALVYNVAYNLAEDAGLALKFPLISVYRPSGYKLDTTQTFAAKRAGMNIAYSEDLTKTTKARFLVANLSYQIEVFTKSQEDLNDISLNLLQAFTLDPMLAVIQKDPASLEEYVESYDVVYESGPHEASEFQNGDRIYHYSIVFRVDTARLLTFADVNLIRELQLSVNDADEVRQYSTNVVFDNNVSTSSTTNLYANIGKAYLDLFTTGYVYLDTEKHKILDIVINSAGHTINLVEQGSITILPTGQVINDNTLFTITDNVECTLLISLQKE